MDIKEIMALQELEIILVLLVQLIVQQQLLKKFQIE